MLECADLFQEAADTLRELKFYHEALRYYEPLQRLNGYKDTSFYMEMASCYEAIGRKQEAEGCYQRVIELDDGNYEARVKLGEVRQGSDPLRRENPQANKGHLMRPQQSTGDRGEKRQRKFKTGQGSTSSILYQSAKRFAEEGNQMHEDKIHSLFLKRENIKNDVEDGNYASKAEWMAATKALVQDFRNNKVFYPAEKHHKFLGYSKEARTMAMKPKHELTPLTDSSTVIYGTSLVVVAAFQELINGFRNRGWTAD